MCRLRPRFTVYVCTAADREYALEVWRLLDPEAELIPFNSRMTHFKAGMQKKDINTVLSLQADPAHLNALRTAMPLAVVLDDRLDVSILTAAHPTSASEANVLARRETACCQLLSLDLLRAGMTCPRSQSLWRTHLVTAPPPLRPRSLLAGLGRSLSAADPAGRGPSRPTPRQLQPRAQVSTIPHTTTKQPRS